MKKYKYERYTLRLTKDVADFVNIVSKRRGIAPTVLIKSILGEYKEAHGYGKDER